MKDKALLIVESPFQLLCAYEAIFAYKLQNYDLVVRLTEHAHNNNQLKEIANVLNIQNVTYQLIKTTKTPLELLKMLCFVIKYKIRDYKYYFIGNYLSGYLQIFLKFITKSKHKQIILLDDGVATFQIQKKLLKQKKSFELFTIFSNIIPINEQKVMLNRFTLLKQKNLHTKKVSKNIFIGGQIVDIGLISIDTYIRILKKALHYSNDKLIYIPHRSESKNVIQKIQEIEGIVVKEINLPIELFLINENIEPAKIFSVISTALFSLSILFPNSNIISFRTSIYKTGRKEHIENLFMIFEQDPNIKVIDI